MKQVFEKVDINFLTKATVQSSSKGPPHRNWMVLDMGAGGAHVVFTLKKALEAGIVPTDNALHFIS